MKLRDKIKYTFATMLASATIGSIIALKVAQHRRAQITPEEMRLLDQRRNSAFAAKEPPKVAGPGGAAAGAGTGTPPVTSAVAGVANGAEINDVPTTDPMPLARQHGASVKTP